jgi:hypothetical protein
MLMSNLNDKRYVPFFRECEFEGKVEFTQLEALGPDGAWRPGPEKDCSSAIKCALGNRDCVFALGLERSKVDRAKDIS